MSIEEHRETTAALPDDSGFTVVGTVKPQPKTTGRKLQLLGVRVGGSVSKSLASSVVAAGIVGVAEGPSLAHASTLVTYATLEAAADSLAIVRMTVGGGRVVQLTKLVKAYAQHHPGALESLTCGGALQAAKYAAGANVVGLLAAAAVQEAIAVGYFVKSGGTDKEQLGHDTACVAVTAAGALSGAAAGSAVGTLVFPGAGTILGSMIGSYAGGWLAPGMLPVRPKAATATPDDDEEETVQVRAHADGDWIVISNVRRLHGGDDAEAPANPFDDPMGLQEGPEASYAHIPKSSACFLEKDDDIEAMLHDSPADEVVLVYEYCKDQ